MRLDGYLERIGYAGPREPTLPTLVALHRAHLRSIPYENLDIHLGRPLRLDPGRFFEKLVEERRGGWCYEMNGLFAWALGRLGFRVDLLAGAVDRARSGDRATGNHLVLLVHLDEPWVADVGFGDGFLEPLPLRAGEYWQGFLDFRLEREGDRWVVRNHRYGAAAGYDFTPVPIELPALAERCAELQTSPESGFVRKTVCQRHTPEGIVTLRGAVLRRVTEAGPSERVIEGAAEFDAALREHFDLRLPEAPALWERVWSRHLEWLGAEQSGPQAG